MHRKRFRLPDFAAKERKRALPRKNCKRPGLKQPGLGTPDMLPCHPSACPVLARVLLRVGGGMPPSCPSKAGGLPPLLPPPAPGRRKIKGQQGVGATAL